jgi:hypothetical protein
MMPADKRLGTQEGGRKKHNFSIVPPDLPAQDADFGLGEGTDTVMPHWAVTFLYSRCDLSDMLTLLLFAASFALIPINEWYVLNRSAQRGSSVEHLEALFALEDDRGIGRPRVPRLWDPHR